MTELNETPQCLKCGREIPVGYSVCPCWTADELLGFGIDPVVYGRALPHPPLVEVDEDMEAIRQRTLEMGYHDVAPRQLRKEEAESTQRGTLSLWEKILQVQGHCAYVEKIVKEHLQDERYTD